MTRSIVVMVALALAACGIPADAHRVKLVPYKAVAVEAVNPETTDEDLYSAAVWMLGDVRTFRDDGTRLIKTAFEDVGILVTKAPENVFDRTTRIFHRLVVRPVEGQLWVFVDCVGADAGDLYRLRGDPCGPKREKGWQEIADKAARSIVDDADYRSQRRAERTKAQH